MAAGSVRSPTVSAPVEIVFTPWPYDAVARGVALLDEKVPGWRDRLSPNYLNMGDCEDCILGQMYGWYEDGLAMVGLSDDPDPWLAGRFGLCLPSRSETTQETTSRYEVLTRAWREAIAGGAA